MWKFVGSFFLRKRFKNEASYSLLFEYELKIHIRKENQQNYFHEFCGRLAHHKQSLMIVEPCSIPLWFGGMLLESASWSIGNKFFKLNSFKFLQRAIVVEAFSHGYILFLFATINVHSISTILSRSPILSPLFAAFFFFFISEIAAHIPTKCEPVNHCLLWVTL